MRITKSHLVKEDGKHWVIIEREKNEEAGYPWERAKRDERIEFWIAFATALAWFIAGIAVLWGLMWLGMEATK